MKNPPHMEKLEAFLRSSGLVAGGFMGDDQRSLTEVIEADISVLSRAGYSVQQLVERMREITDIAIPRLGTWARIDPRCQAKVDETQGYLICPWPHAGKYAKRVTTVRLLDSGRSMMWSDLNIHLIERHSFFEGKNSSFRIEPKELVEILFHE